MKLSRVRPKLQYRLQETEDAGSMEHLLRKTASSVHCQPKRKTIWAVTGKHTGAGAPESLELIYHHTCAPDARHGAIQDLMFSWLGFGLVLAFYVPHSSLLE